MNKILATGIISALAILPTFAAAQTTSTTNNTALIAVLEQLLQSLTLELQQLLSQRVSSTSQTTPFVATTTTNQTFTTPSGAVIDSLGNIISAAPFTSTSTSATVSAPALNAPPSNTTSGTQDRESTGTTETIAGCSPNPSFSISTSTSGSQEEVDYNYGTGCPIASTDTVVMSITGQHILQASDNAPSLTGHGQIVGQTYTYAFRTNTEDALLTDGDIHWAQALATNPTVPVIDGSFFIPAITDGTGTFIFTIDPVEYTSSF